MNPTDWPTEVPATALAEIDKRWARRGRGNPRSGLGRWDAVGSVADVPVPVLKSRLRRKADSILPRFLSVSVSFGDYTGTSLPARAQPLEQISGTICSTRLGQHSRRPLGLLLCLFAHAICNLPRRSGSLASYECRNAKRNWRMRSYSQGGPGGMCLGN